MPSGLTGFQHTHVYQNRAPVAAVLDDLGRIGPIALEADRRRRARFRAAVGVFIAAGVALVLAAFVTDVGYAGLILLVAAGVAALAGFALVFSAKRMTRVVTAPRYVDFVANLLPVLARDMAPDVPVDVRLDLLPDDQRGKPTTGPWEEQHYHNPWLRLGGRFLDGTAFQLQFTDHRRVRRRRKTRRNARGKTKTKTKEKSRARSVVLLRLRVKPQRYRHLERIAPQAPQAVQLAPGVQKHKLDVAADHLSLRVRLGGWSGGGPGAGTGGPADANAAHVVMMMFLSLYQVLNLSRAIDKAQPAGGVR